jgi:hypothetical protein
MRVPTTIDEVYGLKNSSHALFKAVVEHEQSVFKDMLNFTPYEHIVIKTHYFINGHIEFKGEDEDESSEDIRICGEV